MLSVEYWNEIKAQNFDFGNLTAYGRKWWIASENKHIMLLLTAEPTPGMPKLFL